MRLAPARIRVVPIGQCRAPRCAPPPSRRYMAVVAHVVVIAFQRGSPAQPHATRLRIVASASRPSEPLDVVDTQLAALQRGDTAGCLALMSCQNERSDADMRFSAWFDSPLYESLLFCKGWSHRGIVTLREVQSVVERPNGHILLCKTPVQQLARVVVEPGRPKWAASQWFGSRVGRSLPPVTYLWTLSLQAGEKGDERAGSQPGRWTVDRFAPEAPSFASDTSTHREYIESLIIGSEPWK